MNYSVDSFVFVCVCVSEEHIRAKHTHETKKKEHFISQLKEKTEFGWFGRVREREKDKIELIIVVTGLCISV